MISNIALKDVQIDPFSISENEMIVIAFPKSASKNFAIATSIAQQATAYKHGEFLGQLMHICLFKKTHRDASIAYALLGYVSSWKGTIVFLNGVPVRQIWNVSGVLDCYIQSSQNRNKDAHCVRVIDDPNFVPKRAGMISISNEIKTKRVDVKQYEHPCSYIYQTNKLVPNHPATYQDQILAEGIRKSCNLCPNFNPDRFKESGIVTFVVDDDFN